MRYSVKPRIAVGVVDLQRQVQQKNVAVGCSQLSDTLFTVSQEFYLIFFKEAGISFPLKKY